MIAQLFTSVGDSCSILHMWCSNCVVFVKFFNKPKMVNKLANSGKDGGEDWPRQKLERESEREIIILS